MKVNIQKVLSTLVVCITVFVALGGCGASDADTSVTANTEITTTDTSIKATDNQAQNRVNEDLQNRLTEGTEEYRGFLMDNVLHSDSLGEIHYHIYVPDSYDGSEGYALYVTLPGYEGLYFQGVGVNLRSENFAVEALEYNDKMIIVAPQLDDWGETSANKTVELVRFLLDYYNIDTSRVYANGYSGGGETMSLVLEKAPELFTAYLHCSSKWDGDFSGVIENKVPIYFVIGENDEYYSSEPTKETYEDMHKAYEKAGLTDLQIDKLLVLDVKEHSYFTAGGISVEHGGGVLFAQDENIMGWLFSQEK